MSSLFETVAAAFLLAIALLTSGNVLLRETLGQQIPDWFDLSRQLQAIAMFWGIAWPPGAAATSAWTVWSTARGRRRIDLLATALTPASAAAGLDGLGQSAVPARRAPAICACRWWFIACLPWRHGGGAAGGVRLGQPVARAVRSSTGGRRSRMMDRDPRRPLGFAG